MIPNRKQMIKVLKGLEEVVHEQGWDQASVLSLLYEYKDDDMAATAAVPFPVQPSRFAPQAPGEGLMYLGGIARTGNMPQVLSEQMQRSFTGAVFVTEGWQSEIPSDERDSRRLADIPGSKEIRIVFAIDAGGRAYTIHRIRGKKPTIEVIEKGTTEDGGTAEMTGHVIIGLRDLMYALCQQLPLGSADLDAIAEIGAKGLEDSL